jgi:hypothetical protein
MPEIPSAKVMRRQLRDLVRENQKSILQKLPSGAKLSLALDCWTSPFRQAFMAITGYFLDEDWEYHEILLGFEHLHGSHSGANLSEVLLQLLQEHQITDRVLAVTTDNASNNVTLMASVHEAIESLQSSNDVVIIRVPCIAHVIQLSLKDLLGKMKAAPKNDTAEQAWSDDRVDSLRARQQKREIVDTLNKVRHRDFISNLSFIILMCFLGSKPCDLYQRESSAPRVILQLANQGAETCANPRCCYSMELHVLNARTRKETPAGLRCFLLSVRPRALFLESGAVAASGLSYLHSSAFSPIHNPSLEVQGCHYPSGL